MRANQINEGVGVERLSEIAAGSVVLGTLREQVVMPGDEDDRRVSAKGSEQSLKLQTAHAAEVNVEDDAVRFVANEAPQELLGGREGLGADAIPPQRAGECSTQRRIVLDNANPGLRLIIRVAVVLESDQGTSHFRTNAEPC